MISGPQLLLLHFKLKVFSKFMSRLSARSFFLLSQYQMNKSNDFYACSIEFLVILNNPSKTNILAVNQIIRYSGVVFSITKTQL